AFVNLQLAEQQLAGTTSQPLARNLVDVIGTIDQNINANEAVLVRTYCASPPPRPITPPPSPITPTPPPITPTPPPPTPTPSPPTPTPSPSGTPTTFGTPSTIASPNRYVIETH